MSKNRSQEVYLGQMCDSCYCLWTREQYSKANYTLPKGQSLNIHKGFSTQSKMSSIWIPDMPWYHIKPPGSQGEFFRLPFYPWWDNSFYGALRSKSANFLYPRYFAQLGRLWPWRMTLEPGYFGWQCPLVRHWPRHPKQMERSFYDWSLNWWHCRGKCIRLELRFIS